jgi:hypothetical protein
MDDVVAALSAASLGRYVHDVDGRSEHIFADFARNMFPAAFPAAVQGGGAALPVELEAGAIADVDPGDDGIDEEASTSPSSSDMSVAEDAEDIAANDEWGEAGGDDADGGELDGSGGHV